jgi:hypothetical protein
MTDGALTGTQGEVVHYFKQLQKKAHHQVARITQKLRAVGKRIDMREALARLRDIPLRCQNDIVRVNVDFQSGLEFLQEREIRQRQHYEEFREENKLSRLAKYPRLPIIHYTFLVALIGAIAHVLATPPVLGVDGEILVPASKAFSISTLGVILPYIVGAGVFRSVNHIKTAKRVWAWISGVAIILFIGGLSFFTAYYVAALTINPDASMQSAFDAIAANPMEMWTNVAAAKSFGIVVLSGLLALLTGYASDDPYPGYGAVQRAYYRARRENEKQTRLWRDRVNKIVDSAESEVAGATRRTKVQLTQFATMVEKSKRMQGQLGDFDVALEDACNLLLDRYRNTNESVRKSDVPTSFSEHICFRTDNESATSMLQYGNGRLDELRRGASEIEAEAVQVRQKLRELNRSAISNPSFAPSLGYGTYQNREDSSA